MLKFQSNSFGMQRHGVNPHVEIGLEIGLEIGHTRYIVVIGINRDPADSIPNSWTYVTLHIVVEILSFLHTWSMTLSIIK